MIVRCEILIPNIPISPEPCTSEKTLIHIYAKRMSPLSQSRGMKSRRRSLQQSVRDNKTSVQSFRINLTVVLVAIQLLMSDLVHARTTGPKSNLHQSGLTRFIRSSALGYQLKFISTVLLGKFNSMRLANFYICLICLKKLRRST